jgi:ubiquinone/menaquinone biosynthesis C-methylase UbiE
MRKVRLSQILPEGIPGPVAWFYSNVPGRIFRSAQDRLATMVDELLPEDARLVIDVGSGPGSLSIGIARRRPALRVLGVDLSGTMVRIARKNAGALSNLEFRQENAAELSAENGSADLIVSSESMHHWRKPVAVLDEFHRVLRPGGRAWIFDGRDDFSEADQQVWFSQAPSLLKTRPALALQRTILRTHGFTPSEWESLVPSLVEQSRFGEGSIEVLGIYRRLELVRSSSP